MLDLSNEAMNVSRFPRIGKRLDMQQSQLLNHHQDAVGFALLCRVLAMQNARKFKLHQNH